MEEDAGPRPEYFVSSLARGLKVLAAFQPGRTELSSVEIADVANVTVPSAIRIAYTLAQLGYLARNPATKGYRLGPKALGVGLAALSSMALVDIVDPYLRDLRDRTEETVKCAVLHGTDMIYVARYPSRVHPTTATFVGTRLVAHMTSTGRAILSQLPEERAYKILEQSKRKQMTGKSITDLEAIMVELRLARQRGYAVNDQGITLENRSIAAPLIDYLGRAVGAINIAVSAGRVSLKSMERQYGPEVIRTAQEISLLLPPQIEGREEHEGEAEPQHIVSD